MNSWFARGVAACTMGVVLFACSDDDTGRGADPSSSSPGHVAASPSSSSTGSSSSPPASSGSAAPVPPASTGGAVCEPNAACNGIISCENSFFDCGDGGDGGFHGGYAACTCDGSESDPTARLRCTISC